MGRAPWQRAPGASDNRSVHIDLDLALQGDEMHGRASADGQPKRDFTGWVGLIAALDALIEPAGERPR